MKHSKIRSWSSAALVALACACVTAGGPENTYTGRDGHLELDVIEGNPQLEAQLKIVDPRTKLVDGRKLVEFDLRNTRPSALMIEYTVEWFDAAGFKIPMPANWVPLQLGGSGVRTIQITGPTTSAADWRLHVRPRNEVK